MPPEASQSHGTHRRYYPLYHFVVLPILGINFLVMAYFALRRPTLLSLWSVIVAFALAALAWNARYMALRVQDRVIRLEEMLRLQRCLPPELQSRIGELSAGQLIALRFCADEELPELTHAVLTEPIYSREAIKKRIKNWRGDVGPRA
jgi:hypothetical protein